MFSDNNLQFARAELEHATSSPRYPQSIGKVDNAVTGNMQDADGHLYLALFAFRNTPSEGVNVRATLKLFSWRTTTDFGTFNSASDLM